MAFYISIRRRRSTVVLGDVGDILVRDLKSNFVGVYHLTPPDIQLSYKGMVLNDRRNLSHYGIVSTPGSFGELGLQFMSDDGDYEPLEIDVYSVPRSLAEDDEEAI